MVYSSAICVESILIYACVVATDCCSLKCCDYYVVLSYSFFLYSIARPNKHGEPTVDLSKIVVHDGDKLTDHQLKHHRVIQKLFSVYGISAPITKKLYEILRCKLWRMGQKLYNARGNRNKVLEDWKTGRNAVWDLSLDCFKVNKELSAQILSNEKKLNQLTQENNELQIQLEGTKQKLKEIQNTQNQLIKSNKRMASELANSGSKQKKRRQDISQLSRQHKWTRKKQLHTDVSQALSFLENEGVQPSTITLVHNSTSETEILDLESGAYKKPESTSTINDKPELALFVKDRFGLSDLAYHELCMICEQLPRLCKLKQLSKHLNSQWDIKPCPDNNGIQQSLASRVTERVKYLLKKKSISPGDVLRLKLSGDGTKICRKLNLINITFTLLNEGKVAMSPNGNHTLAIINGTEKYESLKTALSDLIMEVRDLKSVTVDDLTFKIEYFICSDLKFLAIIYGIESATSTYSCVWCKCPSSERPDMSKQWSFSDKGKGARTVDDIVACHLKSRREKYGCIHPPLFQTINIDHVIPDILHLYLRVSDVLLNLLITDIRRHDGIIKSSSSDAGSQSSYLDELEFFINNSCKIPFKFSIDKETKQLQWRDLMGPEKHVVFEKIALPELFPKLQNIKATQKLWDDFRQLYSVLQMECVSTNEAETFHEDAKKWVLDFTAIYQSKNVTPYIHIMAMHVPEFLLKYKNLVLFTQQGMEKLNDQTTIDFAKSTNHNYHNLEALTQLMNKRNRIEHLQDSGFQRVPREKTCSVCNEKGHNSRTCKKKL